MKPAATQVHEWGDIPAWGDRKDCPLLDMPLELLDMCFGWASGLGSRDYLALSGTNVFFRNTLNDAFFEAIHAVEQYKTKPDAVVHRPFNRTVKEWCTPILAEADAVVPPSSSPADRATSATWIQQRSSLAVDHAQRQRNVFESGMPQSLRYHFRMQHHCDAYKGLAFGLTHGQEPPNETPTELELAEAHLAYLDQQVVDAEAARDACAPKPSSPRKRARSNDDAEGETGETGEAGVEGRSTKLRCISFDWPSPHRTSVVDTIDRQLISKSSACREYRVSDVDLQALKHVLLKNEYNKNAHARYFQVAAVQALALRKASRKPAEIKDGKRQRRPPGVKPPRALKTIKEKEDGTYAPTKLNCTAILYFYEHKKPINFLGARSKRCGACKKCWAWEQVAMVQGWIDEYGP